MKYSFAVLLLVGLTSACSDDSGTPNNPRDLGVPDTGNDAGVTDTNNTPEPDVPVTPPEISVDVDVLEWERVEIGQRVLKSVFITNTGSEDLAISDVVLEELDRQGPAEFKPGPKWVTKTTLVPQNTFLELQVAYEPTDHETDRGTLTIVSNDGDEARIEIRLQTINAYPDLQAPKLIRFGTVAAGATDTQRIYMYNRGAVPLTLSAIEKSGLGPFAVELIPTEPLPKILQRDEQYGFDVKYTPDAVTVHRATVTVRSDDPNDPDYEIAVLGNSPSACIRVTPSAGDFGAILSGSMATQEFTIFNCSTDLPLTVNNVSLSDDAGGVFSVEVPALPLNLDGFMTQKFTVKATSTTLEAVGELKIESSDDQNSPLFVRLQANPAP